ncbi:ABC transporter B family member 18-like [Vigna radiata var. radiata]|uniref:ABC transporter B family member 18-like n=1 Tax=Vigna radiata var. radiata TaxID=3916 RepID=A0A3Q0FD73_VIGRR|nr:ABC transporter B family member 18-like [Vigna radiata var. radiata]
MEQGQNQSTPQRASMDDALHFLNRVKDVFWDQMEKYDMLLQILKDYKDERITCAVVAARVEELLREHPTLILRFNNFLPKEHEIKLKHEPRQELVRLVDNIKERFKKDQDAYASFLESMKSYKEDKRKTSCDLHGEIAIIFKDHQDLLDEFTRLIPNYDAIGVEETGRDEKGTLSIPNCKQTCLGCFTALLFCTMIWSLIFVYFLSYHDEITRKTKICSFCFLGLVLMIANIFHRPYNIFCIRKYLTKRVREGLLSKILAIGDGWFSQKETFRCDLCHRFAEESVVKPMMGEKMSLGFQTICAVGIGLSVGLMFSWKAAIAMIVVQLVIIVCFYKRGVFKIMKVHDD